MKEHLRWDEKRPASDLPNSSIARDFIMQTIEVEDIASKEERERAELLLGIDGIGAKLFKRFKDSAATIYEKDGSKVWVFPDSIKVFPEPYTEFDRAVKMHIESGGEVGDRKISPMLFNRRLCGLSVQLACETFNYNGEEQCDIFAFWLIDEDEGAEIGVFMSGTELRATIREGDKEPLRFPPSCASVRYIAEIAEQLYASDGSDRA